LNDPETLPSRAALLTFDDGYTSVLRSAVPVLEQFGYPAVMFVPTDFIGRSNEYDRGIEPEEPICGWEELRELESRGVSIQAHGKSHRSFSSLTPDEIRVELEISRDPLQEGLKKLIEVFAYPFGDAGSEPRATAAALQAARYRAACLYRGKTNSLPSDRPFMLERLPMGTETDLASVLSE
jgi:peptidoglycan/xylan/chitin deacetylase (PgdA/CDA1 family)